MRTFVLGICVSSFYLSAATASDGDAERRAKAIYDSYSACLVEATKANVSVIGKCGAPPHVPGFPSPAAVGSQSQSLPITEKTELDPAVKTAILSAMQRTNVGDIVGARSFLASARAVRNGTEVDKFAINLASAMVAIKAGDTGEAVTAAEAAADSKAIPEAQRKTTLGIALVLAVHEKHFEKAAIYAKELQPMGVTDPTVMAAMEEVQKHSLDETAENSCGGVLDQTISVKDIINAVASGPKGEYETTLQAKGRLSKFVPNSHIVVNAPFDGGEYHADEEALVISSFFFLDQLFVFPHFGLGESFTGVTLASQSSDGGSFLGSNAMGAKTVVSRRSYDAVGVVWADLGGGVQFHDVAPITVHLTLTEAPQIRKRLKVQIVGEFSSPWVTSGTSTSAATFSDPNEAQFHNRAIVITPVCEKIFDPITKTIYATQYAR